MMIRLIGRTSLAVALAFTFFWSPSVSAQEADEDASALRSYFSANGLLNRGLHDLAAAEYRSFLDDHADHEKAPVARYGLGVSLFRLERYEEAVDALESALEQPEMAYGAEAATVLGQCHLALGNYADAAASLEQVLADFADHALADDAAALQAEALYYGAAYDQVRRPCRLLTSRWPDSPHRERTELFWSLADMAQGDYSAAAERLSALSQRFPNGALTDQTALLLAQSLHRSHALQAALEQYRRVIRRARDEYLPEALYGLAGLLHGQGQPAAAGEFIDELIRRFPDHRLIPAARLLRGRVFFDLEDFESARNSFEHVIETGDEHEGVAMYWTAKCDLRDGRADAAADRLARATEQFPDSLLAPEMSYDLAVAFSRCGQAEAALQELQRFRRRFADHELGPDAVHLMAASHHQLAQYDESLRLCRLFEEEYPGSAAASSIAFLAAENEFLLADYEHAAASFRDYLDRYPEAPQRTHASFRLGMALYRLERFEEAQPVLAGTVDGPETEPALRSGLLALGDLHFQQGRWPAAEQLLSDYLSFGLDRPSADDALLKLGLAQHRQEKLEEALGAYDRLIERFLDSPHHLQAVFERGQALVSLDRRDEAIEAFRQVLQAGTETIFAVHALNHLGAIAVQQQRFGDAADSFAQVAAIAGDEDVAAEALFQQDQALMSAGQFDRAEVVFDALIRTYPTSQRGPEARGNRAIALARQGKHQLALSAIEELERSEAAALPRSLAAAVAYEKAWCLRALDRNDDAAQAYRELLRNPAEPDLRFHAVLELAELEANAERYEQAAALLRPLRDTSPQSPKPSPDVREQALYRLGLCEYHLEDYAAAADLLEEFIDTCPDSDMLASAGLLCGEALFKTGAHQRAVTHLRRVVQDHPESESFAPSLLRLGECLAVLQHWARSEEAFALYLDRFSDSDLWFQAQFGLAWARENQDRRDQAIETYRDLVERHQGPTAARAQFQIGECLFAEGQLEEAVREFLKVDILYAYPEWSAAALYEAGRCFEELGKPAEARTHFEQVRQDHPDTQWARLASERLAQMSSSSSLPGH